MAMSFAMSGVAGASCGSAAWAELPVNMLARSIVRRMIEVFIAWCERAFLGMAKNVAPPRKDRMSERAVFC
jgi:hypothetical protein